MKPKVNYLKNRDIMKEIHKSKMSFCSTIDDKYYNFDIIISDDMIIDEEIVATAKENRAARLSKEAYDNAVEIWNEGDRKIKDKPKQSDFYIAPSSIDDSDLSIRVMTYSHIPVEERKKNPKTKADHHIKCNFAPFKHYAKINDNWQEVVRSHWVDGFDNGSFSLTGGKVTERLGRMMILLCDRLATKGNWRGYSYVGEMKSSALLQLSGVCLYYDEKKGNDNPFAYYTTCVKNSYTSVLNLEKKHQKLRDALLERNGQLPSFSRQLDDEFAQQQSRKLHEDQITQERKAAGFNII